MRKNFFSDNVREMALKKAGVVPGGMAADIGAGTGFITEALVKRGVSVVAVDQSESMAAELKAKFSTVTVRTGNAADTPIKDENCCTTSECSCQNAAASIFMAAGMK